MAIKKDQVVTEKKDLLLGKKKAVGLVVSDKMQKTLVVRVDRRVKHPLYKKFLIVSRNYKVHDEVNSAKVGDLVSIVETRPLSKDKRWRLVNIVRKSSQAGVLNVEV